MDNFNNLLKKVVFKPKSNPFISRAKLFQNNMTLRVKNCSIKTPQELKKLINECSEQEYERLSKLATKHKTIQSFLNDKQINPKPEFSPLTSKIDNFSFTISCLPVKSMNPLKNQSFMPDWSEVSLLLHLENIGKIAFDKFKVTIHFKLLVEARIYQLLFQNDIKLGDLFLEKLQFLNQRFLHLKYVSLIDWLTECNKLANFREKYVSNQRLISERFKQGDRETTESVHNIIPTIYMSLPSNNNSVYTSREINTTTKDHLKRSIQVSCNILAFKLTRQILKEKEILFPGDLYGTLTPGPNKQSFFPIGKWNTLYPHHGLGIFDTKLEQTKTVYLNNVSFSDKAKRFKYFNVNFDKIGSIMDRGN